MEQSQTLIACEIASRDSLMFTLVQFASLTPPLPRSLSPFRPLRLYIDFLGSFWRTGRIREERKRGMVIMVMMEMVMVLMVVSLWHPNLFLSFFFTYNETSTLFSSTFLLFISFVMSCFITYFPSYLFFSATFFSPEDKSRKFEDHNIDPA